MSRRERSRPMAGQVQDKEEGQLSRSSPEDGELSDTPPDERPVANEPRLGRTMARQGPPQIRPRNTNDHRQRGTVSSRHRVSDRTPPMASHSQRDRPMASQYRRELPSSSRSQPHRHDPSVASHSLRSPPQATLSSHPGKANPSLVSPDSSTSRHELTSKWRSQPCRRNAPEASQSSPHSPRTSHSSRESTAPRRSHHSSPQTSHSSHNAESQTRTRLPPETSPSRHELPSTSRSQPYRRNAPVASQSSYTSPQSSHSSHPRKKESHYRSRVPSDSDRYRRELLHSSKNQPNPPVMSYSTQTPTRPLQSSPLEPTVASRTKRTQPRASQSSPRKITYAQSRIRAPPESPEGSRSRRRSPPQASHSQNTPVRQMTLEGRSPEVQPVASQRSHIFQRRNSWFPVLSSSDEEESAGQLEDPIDSDSDETIPMRYNESEEYPPMAGQVDNQPEFVEQLDNLNVEGETEEKEPLHWYVIDVQNEFMRIMKPPIEKDETKFLPMEEIDADSYRIMCAPYSPENPLEDDHYWCDECDKPYFLACIDHPIYHLCDREVIDEHGQEISTPVSRRAIRTLPEYLVIKASTIQGAGSGVFARYGIPIGIVFGPYQGILHDVPNDRGYVWEIRSLDAPSMYIDGADPDCSNWMRYVNSSRHEEEQNLIAYQHNGSIFYRVYRPIPVNGELFVWYGDSYGKDLGICQVDSPRRNRRRRAGRNPFIKQ